jgi:Cu/Ag efflux protein CusF
MRLWRVVLLVNVALAVGLLIGWATWGRQAAQLEVELAQARQRAVPPGVEQTFNAEGVVRATVPEIGVVVLTHEQIAGFMPSMTMGFRVSDPEALKGLAAGDVVRVTLKGVPPNLVITRITVQGKS